MVGAGLGLPEYLNEMWCGSKMCTGLVDDH